MNHDAAAVSDRGEYSGVAWLVCVDSGPRPDLPPAFDQRVADSFAGSQTILSDRLHTARAYVPTDALSADTVLLICVEEIGGWVPRQDLPPAFDEDIAQAFAREQTRLSEREHQARRFDPA